MSDDNRDTGQLFYAQGDRETRDWFERQWAAWPERVGPRLTTNLSFHYGGVVACRIEHERDPEMSAALKSNIQFLEN